MKNRFLLIIFSLSVSYSFSQMPHLDASFGNDGRTITNFTDSCYHYFNTMVIQPDGKIIILGTNTTGLTISNAIFVARFNPDGSPDITFAENGFFLLSSSDDYYDYRFSSLALQVDGKILIGGTVSYPPPSFGIIRLNTDGSYDSSFATNGKWVNNPNILSEEYGIAVQPDGKILLTGYQGPVTPKMYLTRNNTDGSLDSTFGNNGEVLLPFNNSIGKSIAFQSNGKIIVGGANWIGGSYIDMLIARFNLDGSIDSTFGTNGYSIVPHAGEDDCKSVIVQPDDKILLGGTTGSSNDFEIARLNADGSVDTLFGTSGVTRKNIIGIGSTDFSTGIILLPDGKIINGGLTSNGNSKFFALARFTSTGIIDSTFAMNGIDTLRVSGLSTSTGLDYYTGLNFATSSNGKIVMAGSKNVSIPSMFQLYLTEVDSTGILNQAFGTGGSVTFGENFANDQVNGLLLDVSGNITLWGSSGNNFALARYTTDGILDSTFGNLSGKDTIEDLVIFAGEQDPSGKMYFSGSYNNNIALMRMNPNGFIDSTFGINGVCSISHPSIISGSGRTLGLQSDGKIIIGASISDSTSNNKTAVIRVNVSGSMDASFGNGGIFVFSDTSVNPRLDIYNNDKIVLINRRVPNGDEGVYRINADGTLDLQFLNQIFPHYTHVISFSVQNDNKLIFFGAFLGKNIAFRLDITGDLDSSFGINGVDTLFGPPFGNYHYISNHVVFPDNSYLLPYDYYPNHWYEPGEIHLTKLLNDGTIDSTWAVDGTGIISIDSTPATNIILVLQPDQKILIGKTYWDRWPIDNYNFCVARVVTDLNLGMINNSPKDFNVLLYPNPILGNEIQFSYEISTDNDVYHSITDLSGKIILPGKSMHKNAGKQLDRIVFPKDLPSGYYFLNIHTIDGNATLKFQFIK